MKVIKILGIEKKPKSKKYIIITEDLNYTVSEDMVIKHQLFKEKSFTEDEFKQVIEDILEDEYFNKVINLLSMSHKSEYEIINYIHTNEAKNKQYLKEVQVQNIIKKLKQLDYLNDDRLCDYTIDYYIILRQIYATIFYNNFINIFSNDDKLFTIRICYKRQS